jgi:DNA-directed RNA polymerase specialized sigma24 family protein
MVIRFDELYRRHVADVYRYCFVLLQDAERAEVTTRAVFLDAFDALERGAAPGSPHAWLIRAAHALCRPDGEPVPDVEPVPPFVRRPARELGCDEAARAISLQLDGELPRREAVTLLAHVRSCADCAALARRQRLQRSALRGVAGLPLPPSLPGV